MGSHLDAGADILGTKDGVRQHPGQEQHGVDEQQGGL